jgi:predicted glycogen debranching enzyme
MKLAFDKSITQNFDEASCREWIETNGLGGWASSSIAGAHTRRYHGLLVAATHPPVGRLVLLSRLDEAIIVNGRRSELSCNRFPGTIHPRGYEHLQSFTRELFPTFEYEVDGVRLRKTVAAVNGENTTLVLYEVLAAPAAFSFELRPFMAPRDYHTTSHANDTLRQDASFSDGLFRIKAYDGVPELFVSVPGSVFEPQPSWYFNFEYPVEQYRSLDFREDLFTHGLFHLTLEAGEKLGVIVSTENPEGRDVVKLLEKEASRRKMLLNALPVQDDFTKTFALAADQFVVKRGEDFKTLIAGYHWFSDWGRDTMIALPGICLVTGRFEEAKRILLTFAQSVSEGMLPNRFSDTGETPEYNAADATLWFFVAIYKYLQYTQNEAFVRDELMPVLQDIIAWHDRGTRYNIHVDDDGLLYAGQPGVQLTWMDAKVGDRVVTPRQGKAVEINALWYNALKIYAELAERFMYVNDAREFTARAEQVMHRFSEVFWDEARGCLYDYVDGEYRNTAFRPNQIFAISLPFPLIEGGRAWRMLQAIERKLYTPVGLRSLAPDDPAYHPTYSGNQSQCDEAYHQGTVWSWLLGPYASAIVRVEGDEGRKHARQVLERIIPHLSEAGVGSISEIFDADPPHTARGCIAQAWSVGEILRAYVEDVLMRVPSATRLMIAVN